MTRSVWVAQNIAGRLTGDQTFFTVMSFQVIIHNGVSLEMFRAAATITVPSGVAVTTSPPNVPLQLLLRKWMSPAAWKAADSQAVFTVEVVR